MKWYQFSIKIKSWAATGRQTVQKFEKVPLRCFFSRKFGRFPRGTYESKVHRCCQKADEDNQGQAERFQWFTNREGAHRLIFYWRLLTLFVQSITVFYFSSFIFIFSGFCIFRKTERIQNSKTLECMKLLPSNFQECFMVAKWFI